MTTPGKTRVAIVFGGRSPEHGISCVSAGSVLGALDPDEFEVVPVGITRQGQWVLASGDPARLAISDRKLPEITAGSGAEVVLRADPTAGGLMVLDPTEGPRALADVDVVFPVLHGAYGEDGTIQGMLEMADIPYVGANVFASAAAMDKEFTKKLCAAEGIPVGPYAVLRNGMTLSEQDKQRLGLPVFVKPSRAGSSFGITKVDDWAQLDAAVATAREIDTKVLVEGAIVGREIECGVLEGEAGGAPEASVLAEVRVVSGHDWYDFEAKYIDDACEYDIPAGLPDEVTRQVREYATRAFTALDCSGLARVDFFVTPELDVYLNEINTMPGFTPTSMFPRMWRPPAWSTPSWSTASSAPPCTATPAPADPRPPQDPPTFTERVAIRARMATLAQKVHPSPGVGPGGGSGGAAGGGVAGGGDRGDHGVGERGDPLQRLLVRAGDGDPDGGLPVDGGEHGRAGLLGRVPADLVDRPDVAGGRDGRLGAAAGHGEGRVAVRGVLLGAGGHRPLGQVPHRRREL